MKTKTFNKVLIGAIIIVGGILMNGVFASGGGGAGGGGGGVYLGCPTCGGDPPEMTEPSIPQRKIIIICDEKHYYCPNIPGDKELCEENLQVLVCPRDICEPSEPGNPSCGGQTDAKTFLYCGNSVAINAQSQELCLSNNGATEGDTCVRNDGLCIYKIDPRVNITTVGDGKNSTNTNTNTSTNPNISNTKNAPQTIKTTNSLTKKTPSNLDNKSDNNTDTNTDTNTELNNNAKNDIDSNTDSNTELNNNTKTDTQTQNSGGSNSNSGNGSVSNSYSSESNSGNSNSSLNANENLNSAPSELFNWIDDLKNEENRAPENSICGNGNIEKGEICDDGINNGKNRYCSADCLYSSEAKTVIVRNSLTSNSINEGNAGRYTGSGIAKWLKKTSDLMNQGISRVMSIFGSTTNKIGQSIQVAKDTIKNIIKNNTSPETRALLGKVAEVALEVSKYTVIGATTLLAGTAAALNVMIYRAHFTSYTVQPGDTLSSLGNQFTMTERSMIAKNGLGKGTLNPGMKIKVRNRHFIEKNYLDQLKSVFKDGLEKRHLGKMSSKIDQLFATK